MADFEQFQLAPEGIKYASDANVRTIAMVAMFGPAILGDAQGLVREAARHNVEITPLDASIAAVHSAVSSILLREFPQATERRGIDHALEEFDDGYGMRGGFPTPTSWTYDGRDYYRVRADAIAEGRAHHREAMVNSRYTVTLGQVVGTLLPYMDAVDEQTKTMFEEKFPNYLERAFGNVWNMLHEQTSHVEHFDGIMEYIHLAADHGRSRTVPDLKGGDSYKLNFVMTEADVQRIFSEPIARAFHANMTENGNLKSESLLPSVV